MADDPRPDPSLVEPEGVNAGPPVDGGAAPAGSPPDAPADGPADAPAEDPADGPAGDPAGDHRPEPDPERLAQSSGQGAGELLSAPGSEHGRSAVGPGQETSLGEA